MEAATALLAAASTDTTVRPPASSTNNSSGASGGGRKKRKDGSVSGGNGGSGGRSTNPGSTNTGRQQATGATQWTQTYNPWTGVVQAWPLSQWWPQAPSVLGPRSAAALPHAMTATTAPPFNSAEPSSFANSSSQVPPALFNALHGMSAQAPYGGGGEWFMDTGASTHMASNTGITSTYSSPSSPTHIIVGNGTPLPVQHTGRDSLPTSSSPLQLNNVLISPHLIKNLISVRALTRDNSVSVEFDPFGFSIKDLRTKTTLLRCDSSGELYPLRSTSRAYDSSHGLHATHDTALWHSRLGHSGDDSLHRILRSFGYSCSKSDKHTRHACRLGKHVRLPFSASNNICSFPSNCYIVMCGLLLYQATLGSSFT